jgi:quercetin dioxygenase-like cupin family protein
MLAIVAAGVMGSAAVYVGNVMATPASGFVGTTLAAGRLAEFDVQNYFIAEDADGSKRRWRPKKNLWLSVQKTKGDSDLYVQSNVWAPGGSTGWHTHPGHSLITVTAGAITAYEGHDPSCTPIVYTVGTTFVDAGGDHIHVLRNETSEEARTITVQVIPAGATRRVDAEAPAGCPM